MATLRMVSRYKEYENMDELEKNAPDDFWRKAFDEAAETPPARVWDTIERRLDESSAPKIIPLWGIGPASSRPLIWGTGLAAALALLIVGWWAMRNATSNSSIAQRQPVSPTPNVAMAPTTLKKSSAPNSPDQSAEGSIAVVTNHAKINDRQAVTSSRQAPVPSQSVRGTSDIAILQTRTISDNKANPLRTKSTAAATFHDASAPAAADEFIVANPVVVKSSASDRTTISGTVQANQTEAWVVEQLAGKPLRMRSQGPIQRIVWFQPAELPLEPELTKEQRKKREMWASVSAMPNSFNPVVSVYSAQSALKNSVAMASANTNQSSVNSRANFSMAYQAGAGVQLDEHWSVESGIGYLVGHSTVEAPTQSTSYGYGLIAGANTDRSVAVNNLYVDALRSSSKALSNAAPASYDVLTTNNSYLTQNSYTSQSQQTLSNDYQYMQVPVQIGYQLRPRKRLSLAVLGGLLTNIFVRNTVGSDVVVTAKDGIYRPVSLAATMGARFRYRPSGHWSASLAGMYQPSLGFGTQTDSQVQSHPTSTGMSFGIDYHF